VLRCHGTMTTLSLFAIIFVLNSLPAFAPPTWMLVSAIALSRPEANPWLTALMAATAATAGRLVLAKLAFILVRQRWLSTGTKANIDLVRDRLERHRAMTFGAVLAYTCSPLPSNTLFIAYGLTSLPLAPVAAASLLGRFLTYSFWVVMAMEVAHKVVFDVESVVAYLGGYFVVTQAFMLALVVLFAKLDWRAWFASKTIRLMNQTGPSHQNPSRSPQAAR
jgi:membrane protein YqaA with SNARE-associated domain